MNNLKLFGVVKDIFPQRSGVSQSGNQWWAQDFTLEIADGRYTQVVKFSLTGKALTDDNTKQLVSGNEVTVSFNLASREVQTNDGRTFYNTNANAWRIEGGDHTDGIAPASSTDFQPSFANTTQAQPQAVQPQQPASFAPQPVESDLPF